MRLDDAIICHILKTRIFLRNAKDPKTEYCVLMVSGNHHNKDKFQFATTSPYAELTLHPHPPHVPDARADHEVHASHTLSSSNAIFQKT